MNRRTLLTTAIVAILAGWTAQRKPSEAAFASAVRRELNRRGWSIADLSKRMRREQARYTSGYLESILTDEIGVADGANIAETLGMEIGDLLA